MTKQIPASKGLFIVVDDEDYERASQHSWPLNAQGYPHATIDGENVTLHTWLVGAEKGEEVDHKDHDLLNCRRKNLRKCTKSQNMANMKTPKNNTTGYKGVTIDKRVGRYTARIKVDQHHIHLGNFATAEEAGITYNHAALEHFGEFALFNDIPDWQLLKRPARLPAGRPAQKGGRQ